MFFASCFLHLFNQHILFPLSFDTSASAQNLLLAFFVSACKFFLHKVLIEKNDLFKHTSIAVTVVHSELRYPHCKPNLYCEQRYSCISHAFDKKYRSAFDWFLFRVLYSEPRKFMPRTSGIGAFRESRGAMPPAGPVVVVNYRTHLNHLLYMSSNQLHQS